VTNLGTPELRINPFRAQLSEQCLAGFVATAGEGDARAFFREGQGGRSSNAREGR
jgi:hypothetical protein